MKVRIFISFVLGVITSLFLFTSIQKMKSYFVNDTKKEEYSDSIIKLPFQVSEKFYNEDGFKFIMPNSKPETKSFSTNRNTFGIYSPNSTCNIEFDLTNSFASNQNGKTYNAKISVLDFSSINARIECSKFAIEAILPIILKENYVDIVKAKILEEGTIFKTFNKEQIIQAEKQNLPLIFDGGFLLESLNVAIISTPGKFEIFITDCKNTKCED